MTALDAARRARTLAEELLTLYDVMQNAAAGRTADLVTRVRQLDQFAFAHAVEIAEALLAPAPSSPPPPASEALARFGAMLLPKWWDDGNPGDIDGAEAQEAAEACGLWHQVEHHADGVECEWCGNDGSGCGELTEAGLAALSTSGAGGGKL